MRLIDADELINQGYEIVVDGLQYDTCNKSIDIDTIPTAYDIDKVVEELNELDVTAIKRYEGGTFGNYKGTDYYIKKSDAIEIVKQGGVSDASDYVCEWRIVDRPHNLPIYNTSCGKIRLQYTTGVDIYCNGCGNKIKVKQNDN